MNKKQVLLFLLVFASFGVFAQGFEVNNYKVDITINKEGYFDVVEQYDVNFKQYKHGIYRDVLLKYDFVKQDGSQEKRQLELSNIDVPDHMFDATGKFGRRVSGRANIKIGDPNKTIIGPVHYTIKYRVKNAFIHDSNAVQFYWNLKPTDWIAPFKDMQFTVHLPNGVAVENTDIEVYSGQVGFTNPSTEFNIKNTNGVISGAALADFTSNYGQAVTLLINMPPNSVAEITPIWPFWTKHGWILIVGGIILSFYLVWLKYGKDDPAVMSISYFPPEDLDPAMAGFLINDREDTSDLISLIPYWGAGGYLKVKDLEKDGWFDKADTELTKLKDIPINAPDYQHKIFNGLFKNGATKVKVSTLKNSFYTTMNSAKARLKVAAQRYYEPKSKKVKVKVALALVLLIVVLVPTLLYFWGILAAVAVLVSCIVLMAMNFFMIKKNTKGNKVMSELKGFKQFIKTAEESKIKSLLKDSPGYFEATMGYALTFGALKVWTKKFNNLNVQPPDWYSSATGLNHSMDGFSKSFSNSMTSASRTMISAPSSSGSGSSGGSSGGGFGGGGGGSW